MPELLPESIRLLFLKSIFREIHGDTTTEVLRTGGLSCIVIYRFDEFTHEKY